jgi:phosphoglycerol transferase MdoB-like AlkP superfamily enzyme
VKPVSGFWVPSWRRSAAVSLLLLLAFFCCRLQFLATNWSAVADASLSELVRVFLLGARFDLSFLLLWNLWFFVLETLPESTRGVGRFVRHRLVPRILFFWNVPPIICNLADAAYYEFSGRRSSWAVLSLWQDARDQALQLVRNFWDVTALSILLVALLYWSWERWVVCARRPVRMGWRGYLLFIVLPLVALPLGIRSGVQTKPLGTWHAYAFSNSALGAMALNTPFNLVHTERREQLERLAFFASDTEARALLGHDARRTAPYPPTRDNVVLLVLESFGLEHFGFGKGTLGYMPFLRSLAEKGLSVEMMYANGRRSIDALPSILCGIPALMDESYVTSLYNSTSVNGLAEILGARGYTSSFFHGGHNGSMYLDIMARQCGFQRYYGMNEYPEKGDYDGTWGIFDEPFLQFALRRMGEQQEPFVSGVFTLSSHNPYRIPPKYAGRFPIGTQKLHESLGYADFALERFFAGAERESWYKRTLFVLTADHSIKESSPRFKGDLGNHRIPLIFFHPGRRLNVPFARRVGQQTDIMPTIFDLLGISPSEVSLRLPPFGRSLFDPSAPARVLNRVGNARWGIIDGWYVRTRAGSDLFRVKRLDDDGLGSHSVPGNAAEKEAAVSQMKALLQIYHNGLIDNALVVDSRKDGVGEWAPR